MEFDWLEAPFDLKTISPKEIEESFEDPFSIRLMPEIGDSPLGARYFSLGKSVGDRAIFSVLWTDGKRYRVILAREMAAEELSFYVRRNNAAGAQPVFCSYESHP